MTRDEALKKVKKCMALSRSANEHEAAAAMRQAQKLMAEFGLAEQDVSLADVREARVKTRSAAMNTWEVTLVNLVAKAFGCEQFRSERGGYNGAGNWVVVKEWVFVGLDASADVAGYACDVLLRQCSVARLAHIAKQPKNCKPITKTARGDAFAKGWVWGVAEKVEAFAQPTRNAALLLTYMERNHGEMKSTKVLDKSKLRKLDDGHLNAGWNAGRNAELHRGVGGAEERRLIA
ncbi:DUF2786 domain-containing protein [Hydrogenophaga sp. A37]|uniref:DUF2786 domain-containing protein n=1 Tax=Hydrogenophaga sp. A37 TaxID=1945864 RepID=UPI0009855677|nr:DUF2786 domain-containing protein [Hydrogenophaga sp. A37]OOG81544.1 hypothetical protein B0E41_17440 [Hydrogenophaga sp. A37]